jgi:hypothetical protein
MSKQVKNEIDNLSLCHFQLIAKCAKKAENQQAKYMKHSCFKFFTTIDGHA